ncbi:ATP-binding cassette domain-containing protein [Allohahella marinimesophila]|uniref:Zinc ABC transporter ATP-binding protein ZnuC n=1 Tax=Allohahella marinimesophila TaxID=1054972 RepID=A0ABP7PDZ7_9GAMM
MLLSMDDVNVRIGGQTILSNISLTLEADRITTVIGPNGAGKTTLCKVALGILQPTSGRVQKAPGLRISYVPQRFHIDSSMPLTVRDFLSVSLPFARKRRLLGIAEALELTEVEHCIDKNLHQLSGGETQRVLLARAITQQADLIVLDEPAQGVDVNGQELLYKLISRIRDIRHCGILLISHDLHLVMADTDNVLCLNGHICCAGHPESISNDPAFVSLFGRRAADTLAIYHHHHDHHHHADGTVAEGDHCSNS